MTLKNRDMAIPVQNDAKPSCLNHMERPPPRLNSLIIDGEVCHYSKLLARRLFESVMIIKTMQDDCSILLPLYTT